MNQQQIKASSRGLVKGDMRGIDEVSENVASGKYNGQFIKSNEGNYLPAIILLLYSTQSGSWFTDIHDSKTDSAVVTLRELHLICIIHIDLHGF